MPKYPVEEDSRSHPYAKFPRTPRKPRARDFTLWDLIVSNPGTLKFYKKVSYEVAYRTSIRLRQSLICFGDTWYAIKPRVINEDKMFGGEGSVKFLAPITFDYRLDSLIVDDIAYTVAKKKGIGPDNRDSLAAEAATTQEITNFETHFRTRNAPPHKQPHGKRKNKHEFIMRRIPGDDLFDFLTEDQYGLPKCVLKFNEALYIAILAVRALRELHQLGYIHADIKVENMKFDPKTRNLAIYDFGLTRQAVEINKRCGSLTFMAPETYFQAIVTTLSDIFSLGAVICILFNIFNPFWQRGDITTGIYEEMISRNIDVDFTCRGFLYNYDVDFVNRHEPTLRELIVVFAGMTATEPKARLSDLTTIEQSLLNIYNRLFFPRQPPACDLQWYRFT